MLAGWAAAQGYCSEQPDYAEGMTLAYCEEFSGPGESPDEFGFTTSQEGTTRVAEWGVVEDESGKRWLRADHGNWTVAHLELDAMANADRLVLEYTVAGDGGWLASAVIFLTTSPEGPYGGTGFYVSDVRRFMVRVVQDGEYAFRDRTVNLERGEGEALAVRIHYDRTLGEMDLFLDGQRPTGFPWALSEGDRFRGPEHRYLVLKTQNSPAKWTDLRLWVD